MGAFLFSTGASRALTIVRPSSYEDRNDQQKMQQDNMGADIPFRKWSLVCNEQASTSGSTACYQKVSISMY